MFVAKPGQWEKELPFSPQWLSPVLFLVYKSTSGFPDLCRESSLSPEFKPVLNIVMTVSKQLRKNWWGDGMSMGVGRGCISTRTYPLHTFV